MRWKSPTRVGEYSLKTIAFFIAIPLVPILLIGEAVDRVLQRMVPLQEWHSWFAWRPVKNYSNSEWMWLETIERRGVGLYCDSWCLYREKK